jgi:low affinity Fe/Cu permease
MVMLHRLRPHFRLDRPTRRDPLRRVDRFERLAAWAVHATGGRWGFRLASLTFLVWVASGPYFNFHQSWSSTYSLATTSVTFLLVFLIQNSQNRESKAIHLKLDELLYAAKNARNELIHIEHLTEDQLDRLGERYRKLAERHQAATAGREVPE